MAKACHTKKRAPGGLHIWCQPSQRLLKVLEKPNDTGHLVLPTIILHLLRSEICQFGLDAEGRKAPHQIATYPTRQLGHALENVSVLHIYHSNICLTV